jgi:gluconokinase
MNAPAIMLVGVSGSGKSLLGPMVARSLSAVFDDADDYHLPENRAKLAAGIALTNEDRRPWYVKLRQRILEVRGAGERHVMACPALNVTLRAWLRGDDAADALLFVLLECPRETIEARMKSRSGHFMSPSLVGSQFATLELTDDLIRVRNDRDPQLVLADILSRITPSRLLS